MRRVGLLNLTLSFQDLYCGIMVQLLFATASKLYILLSNLTAYVPDLPNLTTALTKEISVIGASYDV
jgi:hypothetical protein